MTWLDLLLWGGVDLVAIALLVALAVILIDRFDS